MEKRDVTNCDLFLQSIQLTIHCKQRAQNKMKALAMLLRSWCSRMWNTECFLECNKRTIYILCALCTPCCRVNQSFISFAILFQSQYQFYWNFISIFCSSLHSIGFRYQQTARCAHLESRNRFIFISESTLTRKSNPLLTGPVPHSTIHPMQGELWSVRVGQNGSFAWMENWCRCRRNVKTVNSSIRKTLLKLPN